MKYTAVLLIGAFILAACNERKQQSEPEILPPAPKKAVQYIPSNGKACYLQVTGRDSIILSAEIKGDSITGIFNWLPYEKDKKLATFKGRLVGNIAHTISNTMAEGMENKEELIFTLQDSTALVKFGEMLQGDNGVWMYKNKNTARSQVLKKVECKE